jgi:hypothetical protein
MRESMRRWIQFGAAFAMFFIAASLALALPVQRRFIAVRAQNPRPRVMAQRRAARQQQKQQKQIQKQENKPGVRGALGMPSRWVEKLQEMSPEERERFMRNNARFQSLPPRQQEQIRRTLQRWDQMTPQQRDAFRNREQILERMTPEERQEVVNDLAPRWKNLPPDRRELLSGRLRVLRGMTPEQREQELNDPQFMRGLDANEQDLLRKVSNLRLGPGPGQ